MRSAQAALGADTCGWMGAHSAAQRHRFDHSAEPESASDSVYRPAYECSFQRLSSWVFFGQRNNPVNSGSVRAGGRLGGSG